MKWSRARRSSNVEDRRGGSMPGGGIIGKMGVGGIAAVMLVGWMLGKDPLEMLGILSQISETGQVASATTGTTPPTPVDDEASRFIASILGEAEDVWSELLRNQAAHTGPPNWCCLLTGLFLPVVALMPPWDRSTVPWMKRYILISVFQRNARQTRWWR